MVENSHLSRNPPKSPLSANLNKDLKNVRMFLSPLTIKAVRESLFFERQILPVCSQWVPEAGRSLEIGRSSVRGAVFNEG